MRSLLLAFVAGVWLLQQQAALPALWWALLLIPGLSLAWGLRRRPRISRLFLLCCAFAAGFFWAAGRAELRLADALPSAWEGQDITLIGVVAELPRPQERGERFLFDVERVLTPAAQVPPRISLAWYAAGYREKSPQSFSGRFHPGERWQFTVRLKRPHGSYNPGGFDFEAWALEHNIRATGYVRKGEAERLRGMVMRPSYLIERLREAVRDRFRDVLGGMPYEGVLRALAIGDDSGIARADWQVFLRTGVNHLVSIR